MTYRPYTPPAWQSKPLADGRVTLLVVPLKVQMLADCIEPHEVFSNEFIPWKDGQPQHSIEAPYAPGDLIWCRETWSGEYAFRDVIPSQRESVFTPDGLFLRDNIWYWADGSPEFGDFERPRSPVTMPKWASRTWLRCTGVEVRRVSAITEEEAEACGFETHSVCCGAWETGCCGYPDVDYAQNQFFAANRKWAKQDVWAAFTTVEKISKEDV